jgi:hypothetical protein
MRGYMFRNRWGALLFVGLTLAGAAQLVGTGKGDGAIEAAKDRLVAQKAQGENFTIGQPAPAAEQAPKVEFTPDEELIDLAVGEDPTPIDQRKPQDEEPEEAPHDTVILVSKDAPPPDVEP